jgi:hypothetical protein
MRKPLTLEARKTLGVFQTSFKSDGQKNWLNFSTHVFIVKEHVFRGTSESRLKSTCCLRALYYSGQP